MSDPSLRKLEGLILTILLVSLALSWVIARLRSTRPGFNIWKPIAIGVTLRLLAMAAVNATGAGSQLRGGDEDTFLSYAHLVANTPWGRGFIPHGPYQLQTELFAAQIKLLGLGPTSLRVTQIGIATLGIVLIVAAVNDLAGPRAARLCAWVLALEPASIFFNSELGKEPVMLLASGLVVFGGTKFWQRMDLMGVLFACLGGLIAVWTRSYAGWFLVSAAVLLALHAAIRRLDRPVRAMPVVYAVVVAVFIATPTVLGVTSKQSLQKLQQSQNYTTGVQSTGNSGAANGDNLAYESVDLSSRGAVLQNLPIRLFDLVFKPFPWQVQNTSQQLGALGSVFALGGLLLLLRYAWLAKRKLISLTAPILYPFLFLLVAYALAAGNAGTGFRYRTHLVVLGVAAFTVLREHVLAEQVETRELAKSSPDARAESLGPPLLPA